MSSNCVVLVLQLLIVSNPFAPEQFTDLLECPFVEIPVSMFKFIKSHFIHFVLVRQNPSFVRSGPNSLQLFIFLQGKSQSSLKFRHTRCQSIYGFGWN